jgi:hypothetical protein
MSAGTVKPKIYEDDFGLILYFPPSHTPAIQRIQQEWW